MMFFWGFIYRRVKRPRLTKGELEYLKDHAHVGGLKLAEILQRPAALIAEELAMLFRSK